MWLKDVYLKYQETHKYTREDIWHCSNDHMQNTREPSQLQIEGERPNLQILCRELNLKSKSTIFR